MEHSRGILFSFRNVLKPVHADINCRWLSAIEERLSSIRILQSTQPKSTNRAGSAISEEVCIIELTSISSAPGPWQGPEWYGSTSEKMQVIDRALGWCCLMDISSGKAQVRGLRGITMPLVQWVVPFPAIRNGYNYWCKIVGQFTRQGFFL